VQSSQQHGCGTSLQPPHNSPNLALTLFTGLAGVPPPHVFQFAAVKVCILLTF
jgi:hypothetical protein